MNKKRVVTSMENVAPEVLRLIADTYPDGWTHHIKRIDKPNGEFFHAIYVDTLDTSYLIKVKVKVDTQEDLEKEEEKKALAEEKALEEAEQARQHQDPTEDPSEMDF